MVALDVLFGRQSGSGVRLDRLVETQVFFTEAFQTFAEEVTPDATRHLLVWADLASPLLPLLALQELHEKIIAQLLTVEGANVLALGLTLFAADPFLTFVLDLRERYKLAAQTMGAKLFEEDKTRARERSELLLKLGEIERTCAAVKSLVSEHCSEDDGEDDAEEEEEEEEEEVVGGDCGDAY